MAVICPAILAADENQYHREMEKVGQVAHRIQIDLTDGQFATARTIEPHQAWWPVGILTDFHLMYRQPLRAVETILKHKANMIIVHAEADGDFEQVARYCHHVGVKVGVALLPATSPELIRPALGVVDHVLIFDGNLGHYGGKANLELISKIAILKKLKPSLEIGWDGGVNKDNAAHLIKAGVDVLNVGGFIQNADDPAEAFRSLQGIADSL